ncbi:hypothetical protein [Nocardia terpenica]|nr:hypothetical protein [Nocardia terpenica]
MLLDNVVLGFPPAPFVLILLIDNPAVRQAHQIPRQQHQPRPQ